MKPFLKRHKKLVIAIIAVPVALGIIHECVGVLVLLYLVKHFLVG